MVLCGFVRNNDMLDCFSHRCKGNYAPDSGVGSQNRYPTKEMFSISVLRPASSIFTFYL